MRSINKIVNLKTKLLGCYSLPVHNIHVVYLLKIGKHRISYFDVDNIISSLPIKYNKWRYHTSILLKKTNDNIENTHSVLVTYT